MPEKGELGGECGCPLCRCKPANWHDGERYVCAGCAHDMNRRAWMNRVDGSPCCKVVEADEVPKPVPITGYYEDPYDNVWP